MTDTIRNRLKTLPERKALVRAVLQPMQRGKRDRTVVSAYNRLAAGNDGRVHTGISVATTTMRLASSETITEDGSCLTGDAEVLTPDGWVRFDKLPEESTVMQWSSSNGAISWCRNAPLTKAPFKGYLLEADSWFHQLAYTPNHRIPYRNDRDITWRESRADQVSTYGLVLLPVSGEFSGGAEIITVAEARLIAAFQADGSYFEAASKAVRWQFKKRRKVKRLVQLLDDAGWKWTTTKTELGYTRFYVPEAAPFFMRWIGRKKQYGSWLLGWSQEALKAFVEETQYWDATKRLRSWMYFTIHENNAQWVATVAHLVGYSASLRVCENRNIGSYGEHTAKPLHTVAIKPRAEIWSERKHFHEREYKGFVYCVTTETSYFLVRRNGRIVITGNTNLQNLAKKIRALDLLYDIREVMLADVEFHLCASDFAGAELLLVFAYSRDWEWVDRMIAGEKVHEQHCKEFFNLPCHWSEVKKKYPEKYTTGKNITFLSTYSGGVATATRTFNKDYPIHGQRTTEKEVARIQQVLHDLHPLKAWWQEVEEQIERDGGNIVNASGYVRPLRDPDPHMRLKDALAQLPQSTVAWRMNESLCEFHDTCDNQGEVELLHQVHDELLWQALPDRVETSFAASKRIMEKPFKIHGREIHIPIESKVSVLGGSWGRMKTWEDT